MTMQKTVVGELDKSWQKDAEFKARDLTPDEQQVKQFQEITFNLTKFDDTNRTFQAIASTPVVDRQGDSVLQDGWFVENFKMNPVVPWAHDYETPPVARVTEIGINDQGNLQFTYQAPPEGLYDLADTVWNLYRNQFMFAFSVGFIPMDYEGDWREGYTFTKAELLEISAVVVPANPQAVALAFKGEYITEKQAKSLRSKMAQTIKNLEDAMTKAQPKKQEEEPVVDTTAVEKGQLLDAIENEGDWLEKYELFLSVDDVIWTLMDVWFSVTTSVDQWSVLMKEFAQIMMQIAQGTWTPPADAAEDDDWDDWEFLGVGLKNGSDRDKTKALLDALHKKYPDSAAKGLTKGEKVKDNNNMTESQKEVLKQLQAAIGVLLESDNTAEVKTEKVAEKTDATAKKDLSTEGNTDEANKPTVVVPPKEPAEDAEVVEKPVEEQGKVEASEQGNDKPAGEQGEVKSAEDSDDGADRKDVEEDDEVDPDNLTDEQAAEVIRAVNEALEEAQTQETAETKS